MDQNPNSGFMVLRLAPQANQAGGGDGSGSDNSPTQPRELQARPVKKRNKHSKTRTGCTGCKNRKIKCDEGRPRCGKCIRAQSECVYQIPPQQQQQQSRQARQQPQLQPRRSRQQQRQRQVAQREAEQQQQQQLQIQRLQQHSPQLMGRVIPLSQPTHRPNIPMFGGPSRATSGAQLAYHLINNYSAISGDSIPKALLQFSQPHLLSAALTIAASHLEYHTTETQAHHLAHLYQLQYLCTNFNEALKQRWCPELADSLLTTSLSLHMLVFLTVDSEDPSTSWVTRTDPDRLGWLDFQLRLTPLVGSLMQYRHSTMLPELYDATASGQDMVLGNAGQLQPAQIPASWEGLLVRSAHDDFDADQLFRGPLNAIAETRLADGDPTNLFQFLQLAAKVDYSFMTLLQRNDNRALWIFGYWFGLMGRLRAWWVRRRVTRDYFAILQYLTNKLSDGSFPDETTHLMWEGLVFELSVLQQDWWWLRTQHHVAQPARMHGLSEQEVVREVLEVDELQ